MELTENDNFRLICCKWKMEMKNFCLFTANGKPKFVFLDWQTINSNRQLLFQQTCPSIVFKINSSINNKMQQ